MEIAKTYGVTDLNASATRVTAVKKSRAQLQRGLDRAESILAELATVRSRKQALLRVDEALSALEGWRRLPTNVVTSLVKTLADTGMAPKAIADKIGVTDRTVQQALTSEVA
jgi:hypothetical protein